MDIDMVGFSTFKRKARVQSPAFTSGFFQAVFTPACSMLPSTIPRKAFLKSVDGRSAGHKIPFWRLAETTLDNIFLN